MEFQEIETFAEQDLSFMPIRELEARISQYHDAVPEEILDLLEEAVETYNMVAPALPASLEDTARKEIDFLISLYQDKIKGYQSIDNPESPQKMLELLSGNVFRS